MSYLVTTYHWLLLTRPQVADFRCPVRGDRQDIRRVLVTLLVQW